MSRKKTANTVKKGIWDHGWIRRIPLNDDLSSYANLANRNADAVLRQIADCDWANMSMVNGYRYIQCYIVSRKTVREFSIELRRF